MIPINKDIKAIPPSLCVSQENPEKYERDENCPQVSKTTQKRRLEVIAAQTYPTAKTISQKKFTAKKTDTYDSRYRYDDIKDALSAIYNDKCAYCETRERRLRVEHYRPKSIYYWLAYSWDNLFYACEACNSFKSNHFPVEGKRAEFDKSDLKNINALSEKYNKTEKPALLNPENPEDAKLFRYFKFEQDGSINSENERCKYTIQLLHLNEERTLRLWRYEILKKFKENIEFCIRKNEMQKLNFYIEDFVKEANDVTNEYLAFRQYAVKHIINDLVISILN